MDSSQSTLFFCRAGFEHILKDEISLKTDCEIEEVTTGSVLVRRQSDDFEKLYIFETGRLRHVSKISANELKPITNSFLERWIPDTAWSLNCFSTDPAMKKRVGGLQRAIVRAVEKSCPDKYRLYNEKQTGDVLQICYLPERAWIALRPADDVINLQAPRMRMDPRAPSRSYLKIEEAFSRMGVEPMKGQTVVDLGAAPGGWTYACIRRGCNVVAVDHGPLKLPQHEPGWGKVHHIRANGITYMPASHELPVNWMVADMLVAPGVALAQVS